MAPGDPRSDRLRPRRRETGGPVLVARPAPPMLKWVYLVDLALLATHEIDAAHWVQWGTIGLSGGIQLFLLLNLVLFLAFLVGLVDLAQERDRGLWLALGLSVAGVFAFSLHAVLIALGRSGLGNATSMALLSLILLLSSIQAWLTVRSLLERRSAGRGSS